MISSLYDISVYILGDLPLEFQFFYYIFVILLGLCLLFCLFAPFILAYKIVGRD